MRIRVSIRYMPELSVENVSVALSGNVILSGVSFAIEKGDFLCITGPNGAGKSTLLKALLGILPVQQGNVLYFGSPLGERSVRSRIGYLPQRSIGINPIVPATSLEVVLLGVMAKKKFPKRATETDRECARAALRELGADELRDKLYSTLSGGQQQKVLLARCLVGSPDLLVMDEPSTALDPESREDFFKLVKRLNRSKGLTMLIVTHDMDYVGRFANKLLVLDRSVQYFGAAEEYLHMHHLTHHHDYE